MQSWKSKITRNIFKTIIIANTPRSFDDICNAIFFFPANFLSHERIGELLPTECLYPRSSTSAPAESWSWQSGTAMRNLFSHFISQVAASRRLILYLQQHLSLSLSFSLFFSYSLSLPLFLLLSLPLFLPPLQKIAPLYLPPPLPLSLSCSLVISSYAIVRFRFWRSSPILLLEKDGSGHAGQKSEEVTHLHSPVRRQASHLRVAEDVVGCHLPSSRRRRRGGDCRRADDSPRHFGVIRLIGFPSSSDMISQRRRNGQSHLDGGTHAQTARSASDRGDQVLLPTLEATKWEPSMMVD